MLTRHGARPKTEPSAVLKAIESHIRSVYSHTIPQAVIGRLVGSCLSEEATKPSANVQFEFGELVEDLTTPSQAMSPKMYCEHVKGLRDAAGLQSNKQYLQHVQIIIASAHIDYCRLWVFHHCAYVHQ